MVSTSYSDLLCPLDHLKSNKQCSVPRVKGDVMALVMCILRSNYSALTRATILETPFDHARLIFERARCGRKVTEQENYSARKRSARLTIINSKSPFRIIDAPDKQVALACFLVPLLVATSYPQAYVCWVGVEGFVLYQRRWIWSLSKSS